MAEVIQGILNNQEKFNELVQAAFEEVDVDKSGQIDTNELYNAIKALCKQGGVEEPKREECDAAFKELDTDNSGKLSVQEFSVLMRTILENILSSLEASA